MIRIFDRSSDVTETHVTSYGDGGHPVVKNLTNEYIERCARRMMKADVDAQAETVSGAGAADGGSVEHEPDQKKPKLSSCWEASANMALGESAALPVKPYPAKVEEVRMACLFLDCICS